MLKIGKVYKTKKMTKLYRSAFGADGFFLEKGVCFTVVDYITEEEEKDEFADYVVLYEGAKYYLSVRKQDWKVVAYDFQAVC